jgi:hypothetical protein
MSIADFSADCGFRIGMAAMLASLCHQWRRPQTLAGLAVRNQIVKSDNPRSIPESSIAQSSIIPKSPIPNPKSTAVFLW